MIISCSFYDCLHTHTYLASCRILLLKSLYIIQNVYSLTSVYQHIEEADMYYLSLIIYVIVNPVHNTDKHWN